MTLLQVAGVACAVMLGLFAAVQIVSAAVYPVRAKVLNENQLLITNPGPALRHVTIRVHLATRAREFEFDFLPKGDLTLRLRPSDDAVAAKGVDIEGWRWGMKTASYVCFALPRQR